MDETVIERIGAVLTGIGAFIVMVCLVYILDNRALFDKERVEKIDAYKRTRSQPKNIFEVLLANAKQRHPSNSHVDDASGVIVVNETGHHKENELTAARRPSVSTVKTQETRQRLGSLSMAKAMAEITAEQLKQYSKSKGENTDIYVLQHHTRASSRSTTPNKQMDSNGDISDLQIHNPHLENWLKTSVNNTTKNDFAMEAEADKESDTMSIIISDRGGDNLSLNSYRSGGPTTPQPTITDIRNPKDKPKSSVPKVKKPRPSALMKAAFHEMYESQTKFNTIYDERSEYCETPLPPPVRASAHYVRRLQQQKILQQNDKNKGEPWATNASSKVPTTQRSLQQESAKNRLSGRPPLKRYQSDLTNQPVGARNNNSNLNNKSVKQQQQQQQQSPLNSNRRSMLHRKA